MKVREMLSLGLIDETRFGGADEIVHEVLQLRSQTIPMWIEETAVGICESDYSMVGFTCMFDQTVASLALAKAVKERRPDILIALGGYALRTPTGEEVMKSFSFVDVVCSGEGEPVITGLAKASVERSLLEETPGILFRSDGRVVETPAQPFMDLDCSPVPNFEDYFRDVAQLSTDDLVEIEVDTLPFETSRGCWWGAKNHCIFCGIKDDDLAFRSRSAENVLASLRSLAARHGISSFRFSDYILPNRYFTELLPRLARQRPGFRLSCEMKANTNYKRFKALAEAGFAEVQPGIESFSADVLAAMDKGVRPVQNIQILLLGKHFRVHIHYNILFGFPTDEPVSYERMLSVIPNLFHLDPPLTRTEVQITRYAPLQESPQRFGIPKADYHPSYELIFSDQFLRDTSFELSKYCYYFERPYENSPRLQGLYDEICLLIDSWKAVHRERRPELIYTSQEGEIVIRDSRHSTNPIWHPVGALERNVLSLCTWEPRSIVSLRESLGEASEEEFECSMRTLTDRGLVFRDEDWAISLVEVPSSGRDRDIFNRAWSIA